ncbi:coiled-coil domain-containing protein 92 [Callorhinchus milii]|uniref:Coiled-coil domain containing 92 n=1 Tax=Callorhinchus milii TaxID=7868 RepID=A0A4W3IV94_CALMI|nr:coiled-coil domain-containing protein 92 [Callorhinchus milii]XP_042193654.1 coiled-coil domain-containing protein 92 [Callorhinchus milii]|eukprot:gi/632978546/ref/XP_007905974.1/ PREDICTED: coiled-coil domain-containing protein 92 [Callorhinchus milii]
MAGSNLEMQLHSAQKNLLFLQQEHANTLKGLHAEIRKLQQHCADLAFELTMNTSPCDETGSGDSRSEELRKKYEELESQLKAKAEENKELMKELEKKNALILVLETTMKEKEKKYLEELKMKSHKLSMLSSELEQRASTIAYLTSQLHATKKKLMSTVNMTSDPSPGPGSVSTGHKPSPPKEKLLETPRRRMKKSLSTPLNTEFAEVYRLGTDGRKLLLRSEPLEAMPDPTPFLQAREPTDVHLIKEKPLVIPPIPSERTCGEHEAPARDKQHKTHHMGVAHRIPHLAPPQPQPEVETLAVDQVNDRKVVRKHSGTDRTV